MKYAYYPGCAAKGATPELHLSTMKVVERLGDSFLLPVETIPFARPAVIHHLTAMGATPVVRMRSEDEPFLTDNSNEILDCRFADGIDDPVELERRLNTIPGVVENGLFVGLAHVLVIGRDDGTSEVRERSTDPA